MQQYITAISASPTPTSILLLFLVVIAYLLCRRKSLLRGPPSPSWLLGHEGQIPLQATAGVLERKWTKEYGTAFRLASFTGKDAIFVNDPKALQYILGEKPYDFPRGGDITMMGTALLGPGITTMDGAYHQRQRKVLNPAFSPINSMANTWAVLLQDHGAKMIDSIRAQSEEGADHVVDILEWTAKYALDIVGLVAFRHDFGAISEPKVPLVEALAHAFDIAATKMNFVDLLMTMAAIRFPSCIPALIKIPTPLQRAAREFKDLSRRTAMGIMQTALADPKERTGKDVVSSIASSYHSTDPGLKLSLDEVLAQMTTFVLAGQETTSSTMGFLLYELATHPADQERARAEVQELYGRKGNTTLDAKDFESLSFVTAVAKEALRMHPSGHTLPRYSAAADVIPLATPVTLEDGTVTKSIPVRKGERILCSIISYNYLQSVWGADADEWNPERFLDGREINSNVGLFGRLLSFSAGSRGCIAQWRLAVLEMQVVISLMLKNFVIRPAPDAKVKMMVTHFTTMPAVEGQEDKGGRVPLILESLA
ncbi:cytochrome P450 [Cylindrobasidium torrendii FP15055 ss-10]|uniref:Cytochrome P450 n=1 Tax=Cylindrobasidium torrendii FP15055 ss-10 TaxID=1314674 RepID=A0A0D7AYJ6_9AGAR|nr:cytochrome P450 [Cylindrobasidium torrendii FP15055 ss-10]